MRASRALSKLAALALGALACNLITGSSPGPSDSGPSAAGVVLLNEVLFRPQPDQPQFVELKSSASSRATLERLELVNEAGQTYALPVGLPALKSGEVLLILFDGRDRVDGLMVHADRADFLNPISGFIDLVAAGDVILDHVAWGENQIGAVYLGRGGVIPELRPGTTIARIPQATDIDPLHWVPLSPEQATPGAVNPTPKVEGLLPLTGAIIEQPEARLAWYTAAGAAEYRVQVAGDKSFSALVMEETLAAPESDAITMLSLTTGALPPGDYYWRVQAVAADGAAADFSPASLFTIRQAAALRLGRVRPAPAEAKELPVPLFYQRKDTAMLVMEGPAETGDDAWDRPYGGAGPNGPYCARATVAMVNAYYHGSQEVKLSQDRIAYEVFKDLYAGPLLDLKPRGMDDSEVTRALTFALGAAPAFQEGPPATSDSFWQVVKKEIDAGRPVVATTILHIFVITGYEVEEGQRKVKINDSSTGAYSIDIASRMTEQGWQSYWLLPSKGSARPKADESGINGHSDSDEVVDFDEVERFHTDPKERDSDGDKVEDKQDIRASVFDEQYGFAFSRSWQFGGTPQSPGRDFDEDGKPIELDPDSDGGGCFDGLEDLNHDGTYQKEEAETYNFDKQDDRCMEGTVRLAQKQQAEGHEKTATLELTLAARPEVAGESNGEALGTFTVAGTVTDGDCSFSYGTSVAVQLDLKIAGAGDGPYTIEALQTQPVKETQRHYLCDTPIDLIIDWDVGLSLSDVNFEDGKYEDKSDDREIILYLGQPEEPVG